MKTIKLALGLFLFFPSLGFTCSFDTDCTVGSKCVKAPGRLEGFCSSGNDNDRQPYKDPFGNGEGKTCSLDTECSVGTKCVKQEGRLYGVCVKR